MWELADIFNVVDVRLQNGNHDTMTCYHLYLALECYFRNYGNVNFSHDYKMLQCYKFGDCAIFYTHGGRNLKKLKGSIPDLFREEWGSCLFRELHVGHYHHEEITKEENGLVVRQVGSPSGVDNWHWENGFGTAQQKYQVFVWDAKNGLQDQKWFNFQKIDK